MALGDGIRRNIASVTQQERDRFRDAIIALNNAKFFPGSRTDFPAGGVSYWFKQDEIHQATHVHGTPAFLPWHRELCNRFEAILREVDSDLSLHYWDWNQDPTPLFTANFMGNAQGDVGAPWLGAGLYNPNPNPADNYRDNQVHYLLNRSGNTSYEAHSNPADPPQSLTRNTQAGAPPVGTSNFGGTYWATDTDFMNAPDFPSFEALMQSHAHGHAHGWIGGNLADPHMSFRDPFVFLLHSNVDRLWATWQTQPGHSERLDPNQAYGVYSNDPSITASLQPWAGEAGWQDYPDSTLGHWPTRPWYPPENQQITKTSKDPSVVTPPRYDTNLRADVHHLYFNGSTWVDQNLTNGNGPLAQITRSGISSFADSAGEHVYYMGGDLHVHQLYFNGSSWADQDLTIRGNGPLVQIGSGMSSFADSAGEHVCYIGVDSHVHQLYFNGSSWVDQDLTRRTNGPFAASAIAISGFASGDGEHVFYLGL